MFSEAASCKVHVVVPWSVVYSGDCGLCGVVRGVLWNGVVWCGLLWTGGVWCTVVWCCVVWCTVDWWSVVYCGVVGVVWCTVDWLHRGDNLDRFAGN